MLLVSWHYFKKLWRQVTQLSPVRWHNSTQHQDTDSHSWKDWGITGSLEVKWFGTKYRDRRCQDKSVGCTGAEGAEMKQAKSDIQDKQHQQNYEKKVLLYLFKQGVLSIMNARRHTTEHSLDRWEVTQLKWTSVICILPVLAAGTF